MSFVMLKKRGEPAGSRRTQRPLSRSFSPTRTSLEAGSTNHPRSVLEKVNAHTDGSLASVLGQSPGLVIGGANDPQELEANRIADLVVQRASRDRWDVSRPRAYNFETNEIPRGQLLAQGGDVSNFTHRIPDQVRGVERALASPRSSAPRQEVIGESMSDSRSGVVTHTGPDAHEACKQLGVEGFSVGNHVAFDRPNPRLRVTAHELAHVAANQRTGTHNVLRGYWESKTNGVDYRVSDNYDLAVVQHSKTGSKVAYGNEMLVEQSNEALMNVNSEVILGVDSSDTLSFPSRDLYPGKLKRISVERMLSDAEMDANPGDDARSGLWPTDCRVAAHHVTGALNNGHRLQIRSSLDAPPFVDPTEHPAVQVARVFAELYPQDIDWRKFDALVAETDEAQAAFEANPTDITSTEFDWAARAVLNLAIEPYEAFASLDEDLAASEAERGGINRAALPRIGEAYATLTGGMDADPKTWNYHFGGVVIVSGNDRMTLENYAVSCSEGQQCELGDNWVLQLYGVGKQSFHDQHAATKQHGTKPVTAVFTQPGLAAEE